MAKVIKDVAFYSGCQHICPAHGRAITLHIDLHMGTFGHPHLNLVRCVTWKGCKREVTLYPSEISISAPICKHLRVSKRSNLDTFFCSPVPPQRLGGEFFFFENVMPLMRNFSGSAVLIERTVCGSPPAGLVWDKTIEDILCSCVGENGTPATSLHTQ